MLHALVGTIAQSNDAIQFFVITHLVGVGLLAEHKSHPACIQAKHLSADNDLLAIITNVGVVAFFANDCDVITDAAEFAVFGNASRKGFRLIGHQLDVCAALLVALLDEGFQFFDFLGLNGFLNVLSY